MSHKVTTTWKGNLQFESDNPNGKTVLMDTTPEHGGNNSGLSPKAMMLSSLAGCSGLDVISILDKMKVKLKDFRIDINGELTDEHPKYYHTVNVEYHFFGENLDEKYCGVMEMFRKFANVNISIHHNS
jgi:putative redox protein